MFDLLKTTLTNIIDPYAEEAKGLAAGYRDEGATHLGRIIGRLDAIHTAVLLDKWHDAPKKFDFSFAEVDGTYEVEVVPAGTTWELDIFTANMSTGAANVVLEVNGRFRAVFTVSVNGITSLGQDGIRGLHLSPGDTLTVRTTGMAPGEGMVGYIQFKARPIVAPPMHTAGQPEVMANRRNDQGEDLERHSTPGIFQAPPLIGPGAVRPVNVPPALPGVRA